MRRLWFRLTMQLRLCCLNKTDSVMPFIVHFLLFLSVLGLFVVAFGILFSVVQYLFN